MGAFRLFVVDETRIGGWLVISATDSEIRFDFLSFLEEDKCSLSVSFSNDFSCLNPSSESIPIF